VTDLNKVQPLLFIEHSSAITLQIMPRL